MDDKNLKIFSHWKSFNPHQKLLKPVAASSCIDFSCALHIDKIKQTRETFYFSAV